MKTQIITLKITVSDDYEDPESWNWSGILDLGHNEQCEMIDYQPVIDLENKGEL